MKKTCAVLLVSFFSFVCLLSCGLEAFYYIDHIPYSEMDTTVRATIMLPSASREGYSNYFTNFVIFYRIYISDALEMALIANTTTKDIYNRSLNSSFNSDFDTLWSYTDKSSTNVSTANLSITFYNRKYFTLSLEGVDIKSVLSTSSLGKTLEISFPTRNGEKPTLRLLNDTTSYVLQRATDVPEGNPSQAFKPKPDNNLYFLNYSDLCNNDNATTTVNADVAANTKANTEFRYTYVSMYIAARGVGFETPPNTIYSQPTFIGVFRLAESS